MSRRAFVLTAPVTLAMAVIAACATSPEPDLSGLGGQGADGGSTLPTPTDAQKDAGSTPPPKKTDAGSTGPKDAAPPQDAAPVDPAACDTSNFFQALLYASEAADQPQPIPCPCADPVAECCYQGQTCVQR